ncbi:MAG: hypothetical protein AAGA58_06410 [Verrucomicrobiota bacterium]
MPDNPPEPDAESEIVTPVSLGSGDTPPPPSAEPAESPAEIVEGTEALESQVVEGEYYGDEQVFHSDGTPAEVNTKSAQASALTVAVILHAVILFVLAIIVAETIKTPPPELTIMAAASGDSDMEIDKKVFEKTKMQKPAAPSRASNTLVANAPSAVALASLDIPNETLSFGLTADFGDGGLGAGPGGASAKFFNQSSSGERFAFIIDVSGSLSDVQFRMIKEELNKSLKKLPSSVNYQVIFFSGPAWFAADSYAASRDGGHIASGGKRFKWSNSTGGAGDFEPDDGLDAYAKVAAKWLPATKTNLNRTRSQIENVPKSYGTDWEWPLVLALSLKPKPDVIYFLTDGAVGGADQMVERVVALNRKPPKAKINTISMMEPRATEHLLSLAKQTKGKFSIVEEDGSTRTVK